MANLSISDLSEEQLERFAKYIIQGPKDECWKWAHKHIKASGYGRFYAPASSGRSHWFYAHRLSFFLHNNHHIDDELLVLHKCGNHSCCNPHHLYQGDYVQNMADRDRHGRTCHGTRHPQAKLDPEKVRRARHLYRYGRRGGITLQSIADEMGVAMPTIRQAILGLTWRRVT